MARTDYEGQIEGGGGSYEFTVTAAEFAPGSPKLIEKAREANRDISQILHCHWYGIADRENQPSMGKLDPYHPSFEMHPAWITLDAGKTVTGGNKRQLGKWYGRAVTSAIEATKDVTPDPFDRIDPMIAETWVGSKWRLEDVVYPQWKKQDGSPVTHTMPVEFIGWAENAAGVTVPTATATYAASNGAPAGDLRTVLVALAKGASDFATFTTEALKVPGVTGDPALLAEVVDQSRLFAQARA